MRTKTDMLARKVAELTIDIQGKTAELRELYAKRRAAVAKI